jgi:hypothetical protein
MEKAFRVSSMQKKRGSASRAKSTPKEEGGGDILNRSGLET